MMISPPSMLEYRARRLASALAEQDQRRAMGRELLPPSYFVRLLERLGVV